MVLVFTAIVSGVIGYVISKLLDALQDNNGYLLLWITLIPKMKKKIRLSCAYLFRIKDGDQYLLIKGNRIDQYQPVGGVYKYYKSFQETYNSLGITPERKRTFFENNDLRVYMLGKSVMGFIHWFNTSKNREYNVTREFYEEIIKPGYLPMDTLVKAKFEYIKQTHSKLHYSEAFQCEEILIHDIYDVKLNDDDLVKLRDKIRNGEKQILFVNQNDIQQEAVNIDGLDVKIGSHTKSIL